MYVQGAENVYDLDFNGDGVTYGDVFHQAEVEYSTRFEYADVDMLRRHFEDAETECAALLEAGLACRPTINVESKSPFYSRCARRHQRDRAPSIYPGTRTCQRVGRRMA